MAGQGISPRSYFLVFATLLVLTATTVAASSLPETLPATGPSGNADLGIAIACLAVGGGLTVIVWSRRGRPTV